MAKFTIAGPADVAPENERPEQLNERMDRQERDIDYANLTGLPYQNIIGEGDPATIVESAVDTSGPPRRWIYKDPGEGQLGPTNTLKGK